MQHVNTEEKHECWLIFSYTCFFTEFNDSVSRTSLADACTYVTYCEGTRSGKKNCTDKLHTPCGRDKVDWFADFGSVCEHSVQDLFCWRILVGTGRHMDDDDLSLGEGPG